MHKEERTRCDGNAGLTKAWMLGSASSESAKARRSILSRSFDVRRPLRPHGRPKVLKKAKETYYSAPKSDSFLLLSVCHEQKPSVPSAGGDDMARERLRADVLLGCGEHGAAAARRERRWWASHVCLSDHRPQRWHETSHGVRGCVCVLEREREREGREARKVASAALSVNPSLGPVQSPLMRVGSTFLGAVAHSSAGLLQLYPNCDLA
jgi:hypothetical protein